MRVFHIILFLIVSVIVGVITSYVPQSTLAAAGDYTAPISATGSNGLNSFVDHTSPTYVVDGTMTKYDGNQWFGFTATLTDCLIKVNCYDGHNGLDYNTLGVEGKDVLAAAKGTVREVRWEVPTNHNKNFGFYVRLWHSDYGQTTVYAHTSSTKMIVSVGDNVTRSQKIAVSGSTGSAAGPPKSPHLHFSVYDGDITATSYSSTIDPQGWLGSGQDPWTRDKGYLFAVSPTSLSLFTTPSTDITSSTTWLPGVYVINGKLTVESGARLTIDRDSVIKFETTASGLEIANGGILDVEGTASSAVYFTSYKDDSVGGDTNGDTTSTSPGLGDWDRIKLDAGASSTIAHAFIRYGASTGQGTPIMIFNFGGNLTLTNTDVATGVNTTAYGVYNPSGTSSITSCNVYGYAYGVEMEGGAVSVASSALHNNSYGVLQSAGTLSVTSSDIYANTIDGIFLSNTSATISSNSIRGNTSFGLDYGISPTTTATLNYWGATSGPFNAKYNPSGTGNKVSDFVNFIPFLTSWP
jgi:murein DD-endopeptidase MepM/ murein hydrolase activator NlpD